jgi:hypothetical protein
MARRIRPRPSSKAPARTRATSGQNGARPNSLVATEPAERQLSADTVHCQAGTNSAQASIERDAGIQNRYSVSLARAAAAASLYSRALTSIWRSTSTLAASAVPS